MNQFGKFPADVICALHPLFRGLTWVAAALSNDDTRGAICCIHIEQTGLTWNLVATDGKRMHIHEFDPGMFSDDIDLLPAGLYEVVAKTAKHIVVVQNTDFSTYPDWRAIVPSHTPTFEHTLNTKTLSRIGIATGILLAIDFTADACAFGCGRKKGDSALITYGPGPDKTGPFLITHELGKAILMPMKMADDDEKTTTPKDDVEATPHIPGFIPEKQSPDEAQ